jgi:hypothetical protein
LGEAATFEVIANSAQAAQEAAGPGTPYAGPHRIGAQLPVLARGDSRCVAIRGVECSEVLVLINRS